MVSRPHPQLELGERVQRLLVEWDGEEGEEDAVEDGDEDEADHEEVDARQEAVGAEVRVGVVDEVHVGLVEPHPEEQEQRLDR